jgi:hypothetical protein
MVASLQQAVERLVLPVDNGLPPVSRRRAVWGRAAQHAIFGVVPVLFTIWWCAFSVGQHAFAVDFHNSFWPAGRSVLHGFSPYVDASSSFVKQGVAFVYPAVGALLFAALAWIPHTAADVLFTVASLAAALGALRVLGVRDWRLYGLTALWPPVASGWQTANVTLLLVFAVAAAWRWRDRAPVAGTLIAVIVSVKVFLWPLALWLLISRRYAALRWAVAVGIAINTLAWAVLGFDQLHAYVALAAAVSKVEEATSYTPLALALHAGFSHAAAYLIDLGIAAGVAALCVRAGRLGRESSVLLLAIVISLLVTPTVWRHYFALLLVPLAIGRPRLSTIWLLPMATYVCPVTTPALWQLILLLGVMTLVASILLCYPEGPQRLWVPRFRVRSRQLARLPL